MSTPTNPNSAPAQTYTTPEISSDISTLLSLPSQTIKSLINPNPNATSSSQQNASATASASDLLSKFSPSSKDLDMGVALSSAYAEEMRSVQRQGLEGELEVAGEGIEGVRVRAEGVQRALGDVKL